MTRDELIKSKGYHLAHINCATYQVILDVLSENNNNIELFAEKTGISLKQAKKLSRCGYDGHSLSKMIDIMIKLGYYPVIEFKKLDELLIKPK